MTDDKAWERNYRQRGLLWSGAPRMLPALPPGSRVLELGCGNGKEIRHMVQQGWEVTAIDFSAAATRLCRRAFRDPVDARVIVADARQLPFPPGTFDGVLAHHVIGHMDTVGRKRCAAEVTRVLTPGGLFSFSDFSTRDFRAGKGSAIEENTFLRGDGIATHYFSDWEAESLFDGLNAVVLDLRTWPLRVRGETHTRSEIGGVFRREAVEQVH